ncbi:hypothetical protein C5C12_09545 [Pseudoclavibacter sp. RFBJ5]|nr:hypothetical protein C5C12_09545 [Pseudoclavibacter sp. RFBJ5]PPF97041.1 hypothetical protein C5C19_13775 [Pseudoclavibacter sp. RFBH5]PPG23728.1 hypothetical protein C5E13_09160 [Pseudoclavibacter sp. RFBI4]
MVMLLSSALTATIDPEPPLSFVSAVAVGILGLGFLIAAFLERSAKLFRPYPRSVAWVAVGFGTLGLILGLTNMALNLGQVSSWLPLVPLTGALLAMGVWSLRMRTKP